MLSIEVLHMQYTLYSAWYLSIITPVFPETLENVCLLLYFEDTAHRS
jgi:hypothetical protein